MENDGLSKLIKQNHKEACVHINIKMQQTRCVHASSR